MPTLIACVAASVALVTAVGLQAPAISVGLRWKPGRSRTLDLIPVELDGDFEIAFKGTPDSGWPAWAWWALAVVVALLLLAGAAFWIWRITRRMPVTTMLRTGAEAGSPSEADARVLQSGLVAAIAVLDDVRDPGNAVVQAWQGLEDAAANAGVARRPAETTSEFTARILYRSRGSADPIAVLLSLYQRVRFGEHAPSAEDIAAARDALTVLVALWQRDFPERRKSKVAR